MVKIVNLFFRGKKLNTFIDIGANIGKYSSYLLENSSAKIIAFEPMPKTFNELIKLKKKYPNRFFVNKMGLGQKKAQKFIYFDKDNLQWANFNSEVNKIDYLKNNKKKIMCSLDTLDNFIKRNRKIINSKIDLSFFSNISSSCRLFIQARFIL